MDTCIYICIYSRWILAALYCVQADKMQETSRQLPGSGVYDIWELHRYTVIQAKSWNSKQSVLVRDT